MIRLDICYACGGTLVQVWTEVQVTDGDRVVWAPVCSDRCASDAANGARGAEIVECEACGKEMAAPAAVIPLDGALVPVCSVVCIELLVAAELERIRCPFCLDPTPRNDRLPLPTQDGFQRFCHARCGLDATLKLGLGRVATLLRRSGPAFSRRGGEA